MTETTSELKLATTNTATAKPKPNRSDQLRKMLKRKSGATLVQMQTAFGWQTHTARAAVSGLRKGGEIVERSDGPTGSVYRIVSTKDAS